MAHKQHPADLATQQYRDVERALVHRSRWAQLTLLLVMAALILGFSLTLILAPKQAFSPIENRTLTTKPSFTLDALTDGSFGRSVSDFCADQFPWRSEFVSIKAGAELLLGKQQNNGVLYGTDNYLIKQAQPTEQAKTTLEQNADYADRFAHALKEQGIPFSAAIVPRSVDVNTSHLPALYDTAHADAAWAWLEDAFGKTELSAQALLTPLRDADRRGEAVWFKTDHHWTPLGAYVAYAALGETLGYEPYPLSSFEEQTVCENFMGTTHASSGMYWLEGEEITLLRYEGDELLVTEIVERGQVARTIQGLYDWQALDTHDEYNVFLGGTNTHILVKDPTREDLPTLLLIKDSFAQSIAPYLARHYNLILIDPRTYKTTSTPLLDLIVEYSPDRVLLLCGIDTLCDAASLKILTFGLK